MPRTRRMANPLSTVSSLRFALIIRRPSFSRSMR
jgi:hypothetical protein